MKLHEINGGIFVMISEEEYEIIENFFTDSMYISNTQLSERQILLAESLVKKGVLNPTVRGFRLA
jgi:hypothetical protein